jgi:DNA mismatch repair protein MutL
MANWGSQPLIEQISLDLSAVQSSVVEASRDRLGELGFEFTNRSEKQVDEMVGDEGEKQVDEMVGDEGEKLALTSVPVMLAGDARLHGFLIDLIVELQESGEAGPLNVAENLADEIAFMKSCRGAVKANQVLSIAEMRRLLADMSTIENPWACVHGRPTVMKLDVNTLDHHFGRHG